MRGYDNSGRAEQARLVSRRIIEAAGSLLVERGWAGTTVGEVAARAGVSAETVYKRFGGKGGLAKAAYDVRLAGDHEPVPIAQRPDVVAMTTETDVVGLVRRYAALARALSERAGPLAAVLFEARGTGSEIADFIRTVEAERLIGAGGFVARLAEIGGLRPDLPGDQARDVVWALISPEMYVLLVIRRGWSHDEYEQWLAAALLSTITHVTSEVKPVGQRPD